MIRPASFRLNEETAVDNLYQQDLKLKEGEILARSQKEFDHFFTLLKSHGMRVLSRVDLAENDTPDALFPNNWVSFHEDGKVVLYPMKTPNRRRERRQDILDGLSEIHKFEIKEVLDLSHFEEKGLYLEGTGSLVLDRENRIAYASLSERTHIEVLEHWCEAMDYKVHSFHSFQRIDGQDHPIYHTNVMMSVGSSLAIVCFDAIRDEKERTALEESLLNTGKAVLHISEEECNHFAGNALEVKTKSGENILVMSTKAFENLSIDKLELIADKIPIVHAPLTTIETVGGGSARCMMAEIFLPKRKKKA